MWRDRFQSEEGYALIFAMLALLILSGATVIVVNQAQTESQVSGDARDREAAIHVAETGGDALIARLNDNSSYTTKLASSPSTSHSIPAATVDDETAEYTWAVNTARTDCPLVTTELGETCFIRPVISGTSAPVDTIYSVGFVPDRATAQKTRVVKMTYDKGFFSPSHALITGGRLDISGNPTVGGLAGNVHSNGSVGISGNPNISGSLTSSGNYSKSGNPQTCTSGVTGCQTGGNRPLIPIPNFTADKFYNQSAPSQGAFDSNGNYIGTWYDMCPPDYNKNTSGKHTVRAPHPNGPCAAGATELWREGQTNEFRRWKPSGDKWDLSGNPQKSQSGGNIDGVYYVVNRNVNISGNPGTASNPMIMSILTHVDNRCTGSAGDKSGNIEISGNPGLAPFLEDVLFMADRDLKISGNPSQSFNGFMAAHEQIDVSGNPSLNGAMAAVDACHTSGSPIGKSDGSERTKVSGNMNLTYDGGLTIPFSDIIRITAWNELRP